LRMARRVITAMGLVALALSLVGCAAPDRTVETTPPLTNWWTLQTNDLDAALIRGDMLVTCQDRKIVVYSISRRIKLWGFTPENDEAMGYWTCDTNYVVATVPLFEQIPTVVTDSDGKPFVVEVETWRTTSITCLDLTTGKVMWRRDIAMKWPNVWIMGEALYLMDYSGIEVRSISDFSLLRSDAIPPEAGARCYPRFVKDGVLFFLAISIIGKPSEWTDFGFDWWTYDIKGRLFRKLYCEGLHNSSSQFHLDALGSNCLLKPSGDKLIVFTGYRLSVARMHPATENYVPEGVLWDDREVIAGGGPSPGVMTQFVRQQRCDMVREVSLPYRPTYAEIWDHRLYCCHDNYGRPAMLQVYSEHGRLLSQWSACAFWPIAQEKFLVADGVTLDILYARTGRRESIAIAPATESDSVYAFYNSEYFCFIRNDSMQILRAREGLIDINLDFGYYSGSRQVIIDGDFLVAW